MERQGTWSVVKFLEENSVSVVPTRENISCYKVANDKHLLAPAQCVCFQKCNIWEICFNPRCKMHEKIILYLTFLTLCELIPPRQEFVCWITKKIDLFFFRNAIFKKKKLTKTQFGIKN